VILWGKSAGAENALGRYYVRTILRASLVRSLPSGAPKLTQPADYKKGEIRRGKGRIDQKQVNGLEQGRLSVWSTTVRTYVTKPGPSAVAGGWRGKKKRCSRSTTYDVIGFACRGGERRLEKLILKVSRSPAAIQGLIKHVEFSPSLATNE
jgi:hypothetical protein